MKKVIALLPIVCFPISVLAQSNYYQSADNEKTVIPLEEITIAGGTGEDSTGSEGKKQGFEAGYSAGRTGGLQLPQSKWMFLGCIGGTLMGPIGGGGVWLFAQSSGDYPLFPPSGTNEYKTGYLAGYYDGTKSKRISNALIRGLLGSAFWVTIVLISTYSMN